MKNKNVRDLWVSNGQNGQNGHFQWTKRTKGTGPNPNP